MLFLLTLSIMARKGSTPGTKNIPVRAKLKEFLAPAPDVVVESIRRKFSDQGVMRKIHQDLLSTYCCVLASIIDHFDVHTYDLREDLRLEQKAMNQYFNEVGAKIRVSKKGDKTEHYAKLELPLQFPRIRQRRQR
jgi:DNA-directed RNA polymerase I subunit RPA49